MRAAQRHVRRRVCIGLLGLLPWLTFAAPVLAHPAVSAVAMVRVRDDGAVTVTLQHDALAFALNDLPARITDPPMYELLNGPVDDLEAALADARLRMEKGLRVLADGRDVPLTLTRAPNAAAVAEWRRDNPGGLLPVKLEFVAEGQLPPGAATMSIQFPRLLGDVILSVELPGAEPVTFPLQPGEASPQLSAPHATTPVAAPGVLEVARRYTVLGFTHILPDGPDHMLFVLGLFLLTPRLKALTWQITAFTIAHSTTLTLTTLHLVTLPSRLVEPTIALSIAFVAVENLLATRVHPWRPVVAFTFGLVHGMGFASALSEVGLPTGQLVTGLIGFNVGVELGHLTVIAAALAALGWCRNRPWYRRRITLPGSVLIAGVAIFWTVQRIFG